MTQASRREFLTLTSAMTLAGLGSMSASKLSTAKEATLTSRVPVTDIYALKQGNHLMPTGSGNTEIHTLWARHDYDGFSLQTNTALEMTGEAAWAFGVALNGDVLCIKRGGTAQPTGSGTTEVHVLSAASRYQEFSLHTGTPLEETGDAPWAFGVGPSDDLFCVKRGSAAHPTGSGTTEVHVLSKASHYQEFTLHTKTALEMTGDAPWSFGMGVNGDLFCIKRGSTAQPTGTGTTEVHVLSAASRYQEFSLHTGTPLEMTGDTPWAFGVGPSDDLFCVKRGSAAHPTGSGTTEVHVLSAASSYQEFSLHTKTALEMTGDAPWAFAGFLPSVGFAFDNSWEFDNKEREEIRNILADAVVAAFTSLLPALVPIIAPAQGLADALGAIVGIPPGTIEIVGSSIAADQFKKAIDTTLAESYGLCGGMAWSALDYFNAGRPTPRHITSPPTRPEGAVLRDYIWKRLIDGMVAGVALTTIEWIAFMKFGIQGGSEEILRRTTREWEALKAHIDAGTPWPIVLIGTTDNPMHDHHVLAYGYSDFRDGTGFLRLYDPNHHGQEAVWFLDFRQKTLVANEGISANSERGPLQGFFCSSYTAAVPPTNV